MDEKAIRHSMAGDDQELCQLKRISLVDFLKSIDEGYLKFYENQANYDKSKNNA